MTTEPGRIERIERRLFEAAAIAEPPPEPDGWGEGVLREIRRIGPPPARDLLWAAVGRALIPLDSAALALAAAMAVAAFLCNIGVHQDVALALFGDAVGALTAGPFGVW